MLFFLFQIWSAIAGPRVVAIGDLHADPEATKAVLKMTELIDDQGAWVGHDAVLIQTGDVTDKGPSSRGVIRLLSQLQKEARLAGGDVIGVLGNHEVMNLIGDWRGVQPQDVAEYGARETRMADLRPRGEMGQWIQAARMVVFHGDTVYVHGGVKSEIAEYGREELQKIQAKHVGSKQFTPLFGVNGPLWYRGYLQNDEPTACVELEKALKHLGAVRMVMGHTTQKTGRITTRCEGAIVAIDTGISAYAGNHFSAFELINGDGRAIYPNETVDLPDPKITDK